MTSSVPRVPACPGGLELSQLVYGTWKLLDDPDAATPPALAARLEACVELGITTIDTAEIYGRYEVEERLGAALREAPGLRDRLQIVTKLGIYVPVPRHPERKVAFYDATAARVVKSAEKSLRLLGTDRIDLFLVHRPDWLTAADDTAEGLERLLRAGKIRAAGVSNYSVHQFALLEQKLGARLGTSAPGPLATNQVELSLFQMAAIEDGTLDQCQARGVRPMAWSPLGGGRLFRADDEAAARVRRALEELGPKYDAPPEAIALAWIMAHPSGPLPVFGTNRIDRVRAAARAAAIRLDREDWYALWTAARGHRIP
jgi:predicted oxidoreductase